MKIHKLAIYEYEVESLSIYKHTTRLPKCVNMMNSIYCGNWQLTNKHIIIIISISREQFQFLTTEIYEHYVVVRRRLYDGCDMTTQNGNTYI